MIFAVVNTKGGVGKTTTAIHLATMLAREAPALLIDGDPQASSASWAVWRRESAREPSPTTTVLKGKAIFSEGKSLAQGFASTVVDAGGRDSVGLRSALLLAQQAIVPVGASHLDSAAITDLMEVVELAKEYNPSIEVRVLLARIDPRTRDADEMLAYLNKEQLNVFTARITERVAYRRAVGEGAIVQEIGRDPQANAEMDAFFQEVTKA
jgi:chromosome partitioning protein